ncbi:MAG TPA: hypothetical protein VE397_08935 [Stellaceae bacterium]|nr:hypothetical protein [Stellaceae bacterium]
MAEFKPDRRQLLRSTAAWIGGLAAVAAAVPARAFEEQTLAAKSPLGLAVADRCSLASDHAALAAQLRTELAQNPALTSLSATCPLCGCPVVVTR